jgi:hypothetical protein
MAKNPQAVSEKAEKFGNFLLTGKRQEAFWFWLIGLGIVIPTITYGSALLIGFLFAVSLDLIEISSAAYVKPITLGIDVGCAAISVFGYYRLWVFYRRKRDKKNVIT